MEIHISQEVHKNREIEYLEYVSRTTFYPFQTCHPQTTDKKFRNFWSRI